MENERKERPSYIIVLDGKTSKYYSMRINPDQMRKFWDLYKSDIKPLQTKLNR